MKLLTGLLIISIALYLFFNSKKEAETIARNFKGFIFLLIIGISLVASEYLGPGPWW